MTSKICFLNFSVLKAFFIVLCFHHTCLAAWTTLINPSDKADKASEKLMSLTNDVKVEDLIKLSERLVSPQEFEGLVRDTKKSKDLKIDTIMHGDDFFFLQAGPIKVVFKWIDKDNIAFKINGHSFTYEEASKTELWQKKIHQLVKDYQNPRNSIVQPESEKVSALLFAPDSSHSDGFIVKLGSHFTSMLVLPLLFQTKIANASFFQNILNNKWALTGIAAVAIALVANHFYQKHKKEHEANKSNITLRLSTARANLAAAQQRGEHNLASYQKEVTDLENLLTEYGSSSNDVGFFGFLFGNRKSRPASYDAIMSRPSTGGTGGSGPGTPIAPPGSLPSSSSPGVF